MDTNKRRAEEDGEDAGEDGIPASSSSFTHPTRILALWWIAVVLFIVSSVYTLDASQRALLVYRLGPSRASLQAALEGIVRHVDVGLDLDLDLDEAERLCRCGDEVGLVLGFVGNSRVAHSRAGLGWGDGRLKDVLAGGRRLGGGGEDGGR